MWMRDPTPETTTSIVLLRLSRTNPNGTLKTPPRSIQLNSGPEISDREKIKQLQRKLTRTAATEMKLLSAFHRRVNSVIKIALISGARRMIHGKSKFIGLVPANHECRGNDEMRMPNKMRSATSRFDHSRLFP